MADLVELTRATALYSAQWSRNGTSSRVLVWCKDPTAAVRKVAFFGHGGAQTNWEDLELGTNSTYMMLANELNCVVISYDVSPGYFRLASGEGVTSRDVFDTQLEHMEMISRLRTLLGDPDNGLLGGAWITTDPDLSLHAGSSSGGYNVWRCQLAPDGTLPYSRDRAITGDPHNRTHSHICNFLYVHIAQSTLSQFHEYVVSDPGDTAYVTNGSTSIAATTLSITGDTLELFRGNRIKVNVSGTDYEFAVMEDSGASPTSIDIFPSVPVVIPDGTAIVLQHPAPEAYGDQSWAQQYLFPRENGYVWRSDDASGDGFPMEIKRQADCDLMLDVTNPRVHEINVLLAGPTGTSLVTSALTGEKSFLNWYTPGVINPLYIDLHDEAQSMWMAYWLYVIAGNTNVVLYCGNGTTNVNWGDPSVPWNKGRNAEFSAAVMKAFLQARGW